MSAVMLEFPHKVQRLHKHRMNRAELDARHSWMMENRDKWENEEIDGEYHETNIMVIQLKALVRQKMPDRFPTISMEKMRRDIADGRKLIEKRNRVKAWMRTMDADLDAITTPEQALFFVFDRLHARKPPTES
ncbi:MAG: hypothetical protein EPN74_00800 [Rhodanobacter sp.]|nr:MAG: hypothetical protein EPN74_00800 [Rhodanobacter sp.]